MIKIQDLVPDSFNPIIKLSQDRKEYISLVVNSLKRKYNFTNPSLQQLMQIPNNLNIKVHIFDWVMNGYSYRTATFKNPHIILPKMSIKSTLAHELGHILLYSFCEHEANYFGAEIQCISPLEDMKQAMSEAIPYTIKTIRQNMSNPNIIKDGTKKLRREGLPLKGIELIKKDCVEAESFGRYL